MKILSVRQSRCPRWRWVSAAVALTPALVAGLAAATPVASFASSSSLAEGTYRDPAGDASNGAPDVTSMRVSDSNRTVTFSVAVAGLPTPETRVDIYLDPDRNGATGDRDGDQYWLILDGENLSRRAWRWNGSGWVAWSPASRRGGFESGVWTESLSTADLNGTQSFVFQAYGVRLKDDRNYGFDSTSRFTYTLGQSGPSPPPTSPSSPTREVAITGFKRAPNPPVAGQSFTVSVTVKRLGRRGRFNGTVYCAASIERREQRWFGSVSPGRAACRWDIPKGAVGKTIRGSIAVGEGGAIKRRSFSGRIVPPSVFLSTGAVTLSPHQPQAGNIFYYAVDIHVHIGAVTRPIGRGSVSCRASIGGRAQPVSAQRVRAGEDVLCGWKLAPGSSGRMLDGVVVVRAEGATLRHTFQLRVR